MDRPLGRDAFSVDDPTARGVSPLVREIARSPVNVLIQGETGVGKEVLATTLHELSERPGPLTRINCAALSTTLLESELFGHDKGAFTGAVTSKTGLLEAAAGGTVFLDEIGELPLAIQSKLLRAVEAREVIRLGSTRAIVIDVRFIAATNRDLPVEVASRRFREDLYFRLDGVTLYIPPLRERSGTIAPLAQRLLDTACRSRGRARIVLAPDVIAALESYAWPGNVRELKAVLERALLLARGGDITAGHLRFAPATPTREPTPAAPTASRVDDSATRPAPWTVIQRAERERMLEALDACAGNQTRAARLLGMSRTSMVTKLTLYRIRRPRR